MKNWNKIIVIWWWSVSRIPPKQVAQPQAAAGGAAVLGMLSFRQLQCVQDEICASRQWDERQMPGEIRFQINKRFKRRCLIGFFESHLIRLESWELCNDRGHPEDRLWSRLKIIPLRRCTVAEKLRIHSKPSSMPRHPKNISTLLLPLAQHTRQFWQPRLILAAVTTVSLLTLA